MVAMLTIQVDEFGVDESIHGNLSRFILFVGLALVRRVSECLSTKCYLVFGHGLSCGGLFVEDCR